jgi:multidrug efflux system membrane fusion protein
VLGAVGTGLCLAAAAFLELRAGSAAASVPVVPTAIPVSVAVVEQSEVATWDEFSGRVESVERVDIRSRVAGPVQSVHFREGDLVSKGELLITIDPAPYAAEVQRTEAQVSMAEDRASYTRSEFERAKRLLGERAIAQREHDLSSNALLEAEAGLKAAQAALQSARLNLGYTQVRAPVAGRVGRLAVTVGNLVAAGLDSPVLTTLVSVDPIYASFDADEVVVARALQEVQGRSDSPARGRIEQIPVAMSTLATSDAPHVGHLQLIDNQVDARSGTVRVRAVFANPQGRLMPGQFAKLRMGQVKTRPALLVSERAVGTDQSKKFVMVVGADNKATYREVTLGAAVDGLRVVTSGLQPQERVIVRGLQRVRPGALVSPEVIAMDHIDADKAASSPRS